MITTTSDDPAARTEYWDLWNQTWRTNRFDGFMERQREAALTMAERLKLRDAKIFDLGCGTGWLGAALRSHGEVAGCDLSASALAEGRKCYPDVTFHLGDFMQLDLSGPFDLIVTADAFAHFDHAACAARVAKLLRPGGGFLLMTPNPSVWRRRSRLSPLPNSVRHADPDQWPSRARIEALLLPYFKIERFWTFDPGGDRGVLFWVENRYLRGAMNRIVGRQRWRSLLERVGLGREFVFEARRI